MFGNKHLAEVKTIIPEGCSRTRIRATTRVSKKLADGTISQTLGDESRGMVVLDFDGHPQKYDQLEVLRDVVAKEAPPCQILVNRTPALFAIAAR